MKLDEEIIKALSLGICVSAEVALRHGWDEAAFLKLAGLCFRHERDGGANNLRKEADSTVHPKVPVVAGEERAG